MDDASERGRRQGLRHHSSVTLDDGVEVVSRQVSYQQRQPHRRPCTALNTFPIKQEEERGSPVGHIPWLSPPTVASSHGVPAALPPTDLGVDVDSHILRSTSTPHSHPQSTLHPHPGSPDQPQYPHHQHQARTVLWIFFRHLPRFLRLLRPLVPSLWRG
ncbi:hypothetical protein BDN72DRAFT_92884 [Pluteus cervinus]|uniref:Uncharacterized protein n=1 Tax=Pluteus cervinus TaxID=181527 RepID=A0ACD3ANN5_9AGAR|nr:hypothetical protein BDN72DRAFT_92884 [Pluteus cervinus]